MQEASKTRIARLRQAMAEAGIDAFFVRDTSNIHWASAFDAVFDEESAHALYVDGSSCVLHTDSRYSGACEDAAAAQGGQLSVSAERVSHAKWLATLLAAQAGECDALVEAVGAAIPASAEPLRLAIEDSMTLSGFRRVEAAIEELEPAARPKLRETDGFIVRLRGVKDAGEVARLKASQAITDAAFSHIVGFMRPGMTEREVQVELDDFMYRHGSEGLAFPSIVACGAHAASPHAQPGDTLLEAGQCVVMDFGAKRAGYCSDMTRTVFLGEPSERLRAGYAAIRDANEQVEAALKPGMTGKEAHELAEHVLASHGFAGKMGHGLGHGVGIDIHEQPLLSPRNGAPLVAGNVVTVEPGVYLAGEFGMRLEDFGVVTDAGYEVFTQSPHEMVVL